MQLKKRTSCYFSMNMRLFLVISCVLLFCQGFTQSTLAPKYSNEFLAIGVGADALGMSNAVIAQTSGVNAGYWNPSGLMGTNKWLDVGFMHSEYFAGIAKYDYLGLSHRIDSQSVAGLSIIRFAVDDIPNTTQLIDNQGRIDYDRITTFTAADYAFLFSYARKSKISGLDLGGNFKIIYRKVGDFAKSWGFGIDAGATYKKSERLKLGVVMRDVTSTFNAWIFSLDQATKEIFTITGNELPQNGLELTLPRLIYGTNYKLPLGKKGLTLSSELDLAMTFDGKRNVLLKTNFASIDPYFGFSFGFKNVAHVRAGIGNIQQVQNFDNKKSWTLQPNIGVGLNVKNITLDYAFTDIGDASIALYSHVISLRLQLKEPQNSLKK
jgi:hypothetical protein